MPGNPGKVIYYSNSWNNSTIFSLESRVVKDTLDSQVFRTKYDLDNRDFFRNPWTSWFQDSALSEIIFIWLGPPGKLGEKGSQGRDGIRLANFWYSSVRKADLHTLNSVLWSYYSKINGIEFVVKFFHDIAVSESQNLTQPED